MKIADVSILAMDQFTLAGTMYQPEGENNGRVVVMNSAYSMNKVDNV